MTGLESLLQPSDVDASYTAAQRDGDELIHRAKKSKVAGFETQEDSVLDRQQAGKKRSTEEGSPTDKQMAREGSKDVRQTILDDEDPVEDDGWESGSISGGEGEDSVAGSNDGNEDLGASPQLTKPSPKSQPTPSTATVEKSGIQSMFLPSLSVGFVRGSGDSDFSDSDAKVADIDVKKNRRGQRARRA